MKRYLLFLLAGLISFSSTIPFFQYSQNKNLWESGYCAGSGKKIVLEAPVEQSFLAEQQEQKIVELSEFVYYNQTDKQWANHMYGDGSIGVTGCGPANLAMIVSSLMGEMINPIEMSNWAYKNGYHVNDGGSYHTLFSVAPKHFGLNVETDVRDRAALIEALRAGKVIVVAMGSGHFTSTGHFITITGLDASARGSVRIVDSNSQERTNVAWDLDLIMKEAKNDATSDGGPFWIISKPN